jgi:M6 family metalloprotease-like protein
MIRRLPTSRAAHVAAFFLLSTLLAATTLAPPAEALMPPSRGNTRGLPAAVRERLRQNPDLFRPQRGFRDVIERQKSRRVMERSRLMRLGLEPEAAATQAAQATAVTRFCPVLCGQYADKPSPDWPAAELHDQLFSLDYSSNNPFGDPGSMREHYRDMSYGTFDVQGGVFGWFALPQPGAFYYSDDNGLGTDRETGETGAFIRHTLQASDATVDFRPYDNDGPDGVPNSGDDDGIVDLVMFVHPNEGGECGSDDIWSHSFHYSGWPEHDGTMFVTDDLGANGQPLRVDDYVIMPALACGGARRIEIGVFSHEFGHALGLPDLYDRTALDPAGLVSSGGMGLYCLMAAGSYGGDYDHAAWPVQMCAWAKEQMGWIEPREIVCDEATALYYQGDAPEALALWRGGDYAGKEKFLVENRQKKKWDTWLLGDGFLITHVDDGVLTQNDEPCPGGNPCPQRYQVMVVEADGQWEMQGPAAPLLGPWFGEAADFFHAGSVDSLTDLTAPSSRGHDGLPSGVAITAIGPSGDKMMASFSVSQTCATLPSLAVTGSRITGGCDLDPFADAGEVVDLAVTLRNLPTAGRAENVQATLTSLDPVWVVPAESNARFPDLDRGRFGETIVPFRLQVAAGAPCGGTARVRIQVTAAGGYASTHELSVTLGRDSLYVPFAPFTDDVEGAGENGWKHYAYVNDDDWAPNVNGNHTAGALPGRSWFTAAPPTGKDVSLEPPAFRPSAASVASWWHRYDLEDDWDGFVLELSNDGGATWFDVGDQTDIGYDDAVTVNPQSTISGRRSWNGLNAGFPQFERAALPLAPWAGEIVQLRFRMATDLATTGATPLTGVNIDDFELTDASVLREQCESTPLCSSTDGTAPVFAGLAEVLNPGLSSCDALDLKWSAAADPSGPVRYLIYASRTTPVPLAQPVASTTALRHRLDGLARGTWHFVVRARDSQGNVDGNAIERSIDLVCDAPSIVVRASRLEETAGCDADDRPDAGEHLALTLTLQNAGASDATGVRAQLRSLSPHVAVAEGFAAWVDLPRAHFEDGDTPFQIRVASDAPCLTPAMLELEIVADGHRETRTIELLLESDLDGESAVCDASAACTTVDAGTVTPVTTRLSPARPNPSKGEAVVRYAIAASEAGALSLSVYDVAGRHVATLFDGVRAAGEYEARWDGRDAAGTRVRGGIYFMRLEAGDRRLVQRVVRID